MSLLWNYTPLILQNSNRLSIAYFKTPAFKFFNRFKTDILAVKFILVFLNISYFSDSIL